MPKFRSIYNWFIFHLPISAEKVFFFVLPGTGYRHDLTATPSNNLIQDSGFHHSIAYSRPTTCEIQEMPNHLCIIMGECGFFYEGYYVSLPGTVLDHLEEAEEEDLDEGQEEDMEKAGEAAEIPALDWVVLDLE